LLLLTGKEVEEVLVFHGRDILTGLPRGVNTAPMGKI